MPNSKDPARAANNTNNDVFNAGAASMLGTDGAAGDFDVMRYPIANLGRDEYPHYVMFFITERKVDIKDEELAGNGRINFDYSQNNTGIDKSNAASGAYTIGGSALGGAKAGASIGRTVGDLAGGPAALTLGATGGLVGLGVGAGIGTAVKVGLKSRTQVLLKKAIALYLPQKPSSTYQADWMAEDLGIVGGVSQQLRGVVSQDGFINGLKAALAGGGGLAASAVMTGASSIDTNGLGNIGSAMQASGGYVQNPFKAQLFKSMGFRQFAFEYSFLPKNPTELLEVQEIIRTFKLYMHPTLGLEKFIMDYPAEFTLAFYHKEKRNEELFKVSNCALTSMSVDYGGTDFVTFRSKPGAPTEITMKLQFTELEILTRNRIEAGY